jgi:protein-S-isoprenylcysteine O-methyltransferase Ste14
VRRIVDPEVVTMLKRLVGSGDKIGLVFLPFLVGGVILNLAFPEFFAVGGPPAGLAALSVLVLAVGVVMWLWSVVLILRRVPKGELITSGPYRLVRHPLYTAVALLVLPWLGFLLNTWLGVVLGVVLYVASRVFAPEEEATLATSFGSRWETYRRSVLLPWV